MWSLRKPTSKGSLLQGAPEVDPVPFPLHPQLSQGTPGRPLGNPYLWVQNSAFPGEDGKEPSRGWSASWSRG